MYTVNEYADTLLAQRISMVSGVSRVQVYGAQKYAVRVQVDPDKLAARGIGIDEVQRAVSSSNTNLPTGRLDGDKQAFTIESSGSLGNAAAYRPIIVAWRNGTAVRLEELGNVIDSVDNDKVVAWYDNKRAVIRRHTAAAGHEYRGGGGQRQKAAARFPQGNSAGDQPLHRFRCVAIDSRFDSRCGVHAAAHRRDRCPGDLPFSAQSLRHPDSRLRRSLLHRRHLRRHVSAGYSLNNLSLMALTLSVGFVVDDAIVMLENIVRHMEMGESRFQAAVNASREIGFTILSMTFSLVAVFIPVLFMSGIVGRLLHEFSVTIVVAILISGFVSLTLTPMLGSRFLKHDHRARHGVAYRALEGGFNVMQRWYEVTLGVAMRFRLVTLSTGDPHAGGHGVPVYDHGHRLHPEPRQRVHVRRHAGTAGCFVRLGGGSQPRGGRSSARAPGCAERRRIRGGG